MPNKEKEDVENWLKENTRDILDEELKRSADAGFVEVTPDAE